MSLATSNRDGGKTSESGHLRALMKGLKGQVLTGLNVSQRGAGANLSVDVAIGDALIPRSDGTYGHPAWNDAVYNQVIAAADVSNPRRDIVVMYIDYGQTPSTAVSNNTNGVVKIKVVAGTPAGSPSDPSGATIQSSVGSGNPYIKLARVRVGAGVTTISNSVIDDLRVLAQGLLQGGWTYDDLYSWVYASATSFTVAGVDLTSVFVPGTWLKVMQGGAAKYFVVKSSSFSTNTTVVVDGGGTYTLANVPIDIPAFSYDRTAAGLTRQILNDPFDEYTELGRHTLTGSAATMTVQNLPPKRYLRIVVSGESSSTGLVQVRLNNDSGSNYCRRTSTDGGADATAVSDNKLVNQTGGGANLSTLTIIDVLNILAREKIVQSRHVANLTNGAANLPSSNLTFGKWANTAALISRVDAFPSTGTWNSGAELIIYGKD